ncbi:MAG: hypothetical protein DRN21_03410, partial [Thermoplasmata archaeon]
MPNSDIETPYKFSNCSTQEKLRKELRDMSRIFQPVRIGIIGVSGRGGLSRHWHKPGGKSIVVAGADINEEYLREFK